MRPHANVSAPSLYGLHLILLAAAICSGPDYAQVQPPAAVRVMPVSVEDVSPQSEFVTRVEAVNAVDIRARVQAFIEARLFTAGQVVQEGQDLFIMEQAQYEAALAAARASLASAQAALRDAKGRL